jgi:hypothetical protein
LHHAAVQTAGKSINLAQDVDFGWKVRIVQRVVIAVKAAIGGGRRGAQRPATCLNGQAHRTGALAHGLLGNFGRMRIAYTLALDCA